MIAGSSESQVETQDRHLRILLETDAPYMVPSNLYESLGKEVKGRLPLCHTGMIPWTAEWVARVLTEAGGSGWDTKRVLQVARENSRTVYGL
jgi:TatD DNase family protein